MSRFEIIGKRILVALYLAMAVFVAGNLLYSAWCAFTWGKFTLFDYGVYTNMIWNSAHGAPFKVLVDDTYLSTHLSFTLALLGSFFWIWDHPFLLSFLQWSMVVGGAVFLVAAARKAKVPGVMTASLIFFWFAYKLTQGVVLSEFHGVSAYFLLVPWLYYECSYRKKMAWLPFILTLGVREEAFLLILPMLIYFAVKDKWRAGYIMCAVAVLYGALAIFVLYPAINGLSVFDRRGSVLKAAVGGDVTARRLHSILWTVLPVMALFHRRSFPSVWFPATALATVLLSGYATQQGMGSHYGASVMVCLGVGLLEVMTLRAGKGDFLRGGQSEIIVRSLLLALVTLSFHCQDGFVLLGGQNGKIYRESSLRGIIALHGARQLPKEGILVTENNLVGYCANRDDILIWRRMSRFGDDIDVVFLEARRLAREHDGKIWDWLVRKQWGIRYFDGEYLIAGKGYDSAANESLLNQLKYGTVLFALTPKHVGEDVRVKPGQWARYWLGKGFRTPAILSYGGSRYLNAGEYNAVFTYRAESPVRKYRDTWGEFSVHILNDQGTPLAEESIQQVASSEGELITQAVRFSLSREAYIEVRVTAGDAKLWMDRAEFIRLEE